MPDHKFNRKATRVTFSGGSQVDLAGIIDHPDVPTDRTAVFCHCFTCGKDLKAIARIGRELARRGITVLRFDFTGIGGSRGDFVRSTFTSTVDDLRAAITFLDDRDQSPQLLIGMSLGGATVLSVASEIDSIKGVVTLASPGDTHHLAAALLRMNPAIETDGQGTVRIGGKHFTIGSNMLDDLRDFDLQSRLESLKKPALIIHSPDDDTLDFAHALKIRESISGPASLLSLDQADHLLVKDPRDVPFVSGMIAAWANRYVFIASRDDHN